MRVPTHDNRVLTLKDFICCYDDYQLLLSLQQRHPNMLIELFTDDPTKKSFVVLSSLDLEHFSTIQLYNTPLH